MIRIIALTEQGKHLAQRLCALLKDAHLCYKPQPFSTVVQGYFKQGDRLIFICATGIVMRTLAPVIKDKYQDPPVLVLDENGEFVIPLLSGHEGGANHWAYQVSALIEATPVITTANAYKNPLYTVGMGCERGCPLEELEDLLMACLTQVKLSLDDISAISSIDIKADEEGLIALAKKLNKPYHTWHKTELARVDHLLSTRSEYVFNTVGVYGVAESAALFTALSLTQASAARIEKKAENITPEPTAELVLNKQKTKKATCAIARSYASR